MVIPPFLQVGDRVGIVAPSRRIKGDQLIKALEVLKDWGLIIKQGDHLLQQDGYFAGTDEQRLSDLQKLINDPDIRCIFCARGGYGMTRIVDELNIDALVRKPKWIVGFSDITALHLLLNKVGVQSIHGLMPVQFEYFGAEASIESLYKILFTGDGQITAAHNEFNRKGEVQASVVGGNLSLVTDSLGTQTEIDTTGKILFLEEIDEYLYKVDRMLVQLKRANKLNNLKGLVLGDFSDLKDTQIPFGRELEELILEKVKEFNYPVAFGFPMGHDIPNHSLPLLKEVQLSVTDSGSEILF